VQQHLRTWIAYGTTYRIVNDILFFIDPEQLSIQKQLFRAVGPRERKAFKIIWKNKEEESSPRADEASGVYQ